MTILSQTILYSSFDEYAAHRPAMLASGYSPRSVSRIPRTGEIKCTWKQELSPVKNN